ncbi:MAG TPA: nucleotidyltransferase family protein [Lunatimonas sp.]|nr:nucleotidyltransferase family protein [Lunatimonas sp.]
MDKISRKNTQSATISNKNIQRSLDTTKEIGSLETEAQIRCGYRSIIGNGVAGAVRISVFVAIKKGKMKIEEVKEKIVPVLIRHRIKRAGIFGSVATGDATGQSDIDILVELEDKISLLEFVGIKYELEDLLGKKVDLVEYKAIKPRLRSGILSEEIRIYG